MKILANRLLNQLVFYACKKYPEENFYTKCLVRKDIHF